MAVYKVSFVVSGSPHPGTIRNLDYRPVPGEVVRIGDALVEVVEVLDLVPPRGGFHYIHATCRIVQSTEAKEHNQGE